MFTSYKTFQRTIIIFIILFLAYATVQAQVTPHNSVDGNVSKNPDLAGYILGSTVIVTATPDAGFIFSSWGGDVSGNVNPLSIVMSSNKHISAIFKPILTNAPVVSAGVFAEDTELPITFRTNLRKP